MQSDIEMTVLLGSGGKVCHPWWWRAIVHRTKQLTDYMKSAIVKHMHGLFEVQKLTGNIFVLYIDKAIFSLLT